MEVHNDWPRPARSSHSTQIPMSTDDSREIRNILASITPQEFEVLRAKFGIELDENTPPEKFTEALFHLTSEKIKSVEREALKKIRGGSHSDDEN